MAIDGEAEVFEDGLAYGQGDVRLVLGLKAVEGIGRPEVGDDKGNISAQSELLFNFGLEIDILVLGPGGVRRK